MKQNAEDKKLKIYFETLDRLDLLPLKKSHNLAYYLDNYIFRNVPIAGKRILEIGAGAGVYSFYMACLGAERVVSLEPETDGSTSGMIEQYQILSSELDISTCTQFEPTTLQLYEPQGERFDVILLYNTINHLNEDACMRLHVEQAARDIYSQYLEKLFALLDNHGIVIIADCSRYNFFSKFDRKNPFAPSIEWEKHQSPEIWASLLKNVGFVQPTIRWRGWRAYGLRKMGRSLFANKICSYFLDSHFCLTMDKINVN